MADLEWYFDDKTTNEILVRSTSVNQETSSRAKILGEVAEGRLAPHKANNAKDKRPGSSIEVTEGSVDAFVTLKDPGGGAAAIAKSLGLFAPFAFGGAAGPVKIKRGRKKRGKRK